MFPEHEIAQLCVHSNADKKNRSILVHCSHNKHKFMYAFCRCAKKIPDKAIQNGWEMKPHGDSCNLIMKNTKQNNKNVWFM